VHLPGILKVCFSLEVQVTFSYILWICSLFTSVNSITLKLCCNQTVTFHQCKQRVTVLILPFSQRRTHQKH
jgi:hypothetical protein